MFVGSIYHRHEKETTELGFVDDSMLGYDVAEIDEDLLNEEIMYGFYKFHGRSRP